MWLVVWPFFFLGFSNSSELVRVSELFLTYTLFDSRKGQKRKLLAAAAAAGVSVAFGSPLGGVLFGLEGKIQNLWNEHVTLIISELDTFASESEVMWRGFVASAIAAVALQYVDPFGTGKLVLFQVCIHKTLEIWLLMLLFRSLVCLMIRGEPLSL